jgi:hypothetical protein
VRLGGLAAAGEEPQAVIPAGQWQSAAPVEGGEAGYTLICMHRRAGVRVPRVRARRARLDARVPLAARHIFSPQCAGLADPVGKLCFVEPPSRTSR